MGTAVVETSDYPSCLLAEAGVLTKLWNAKPLQTRTLVGAVTIANCRIGTDIALWFVNWWILVIGTERHESRRIDNQLHGRSGRQGDPELTPLEDERFGFRAHKSSC